MGFVGGYVRLVSKVWPLVILLWLGLLIFGGIRGPHFLLHTDNEVGETSGTLSAEANAVMKDNFDFSRFTPWIIVAECQRDFPGSINGCAAGSETPVLDDVTKTIFEKVEGELLEKHPEIFDHTKTGSYFAFNGTSVDSLKSNFISKDGTITYLQLGARRDVTQAIRFQAYHTLKSLLPKLKKDYCPNCHYLGTTGGDQLTSDVSEGLAEMLLRTNAIIMPLAIALMVYMVGNWRLLLITLFNIGVVMLGGFALCDVISGFWTRPQSITPQMMEAIGVAITIDYSLFMFTRFIQELNVKRKRWNLRRHQYFLTVHSDTTSPNDQFVSPLHSAPVYGRDYFGLTFDRSLDSVDDPHPGLSNPGKQLLLSALISTVEHSGHVVLVSGLTLLLSFAGFVMTRCPFLIQPALFTALSVLLSIMTALTTTVAFIVGFPAFFTDTNILPAWMYACCCRDKRKTMMFDTDWTGDEVYVEDPDEISYQASTAAAQNFGSTPNRFQSHQSFAYENQGYPVVLNDFEPSATTNVNNNNNNNNNNNKYSDRSQLLSRNGKKSTPTGGTGYGTDSLAALQQSPSQVVAFRGQTKDISTVVDIPAFHKSFSYRFGRFFVKMPWNLLVLIVVFSGMGCLAYFVRDMELSSAYALGIPSNSPSLEALHKMEAGFSPGIIQPFYFIMQWTPKDPAEAPSPTDDIVFQRGSEMVQTFVTMTGIGPEHTRSVFWWNGEYIDNVSKAPEDPAYFALLTQTMSANETQVTYLMTLFSPISPDSPKLVPLIHTMRDNVTHALTVKYSEDTHFYLSGYKVTEQDTIDSAQKTFPLMLSVTFVVVIVIVAILLKSLFVPIRLLLTLALPLSATFGLQVLVFQHGILRWTGLECFNPVINQIYWELPPFCVVVLLSLALDYDVFIISRIAEHRTNGFTNPSSILMGLFDTSSVISAAALIMCLTFSGLMFLKSAATSQLGFCLVVSVLIDGYLVRPIVVPCVMSFADNIGWWPRKVPFTGLKHYDGTVVN